ncbi:GNAT family N-acetyltransferase [Mucilaginibacter gilvus]|uniref:GNAT family N-acetyltransferase n=1 Tax=Mucilaginibacter gilvus TaxID=2305909 RepID=A0A3S4YII9_9SPHI|nr:GNAT family N-acetyltransferase [Mucilaginibacter gilvus]RWY55920.1 GNAT family N-acetyltransferase [Mucilaginibacter gilvus]
MEIVIAKQEHLEIINRIANDTWPHTFGSILSKDQISYMLDWMYNPDALMRQTIELGHHFILASENGDYFGYASYELNYKQQTKTKIHKIYILPGSQGKGIGLLLMNYIENAALQAKNISLSLNVNKDNSAVIFYQRVGFEITGREDIDIGDGFIMEDIVMVKQIG